jgi:SAM-dependent methyltransferase
MLFCRGWGSRMAEASDPGAIPPLSPRPLSCTNALALAWPWGRPRLFPGERGALFDKTAAQYDEEAKIDVTRTVEKIRGVYSFDPECTSMLDFACGTGSCSNLLYSLLRTDAICIGLVSRMREPYTRKIVGVDISQGMVDVYNARMAERGVPSERALGAIRDVLKEPFQTGWQTYDVIVVRILTSRF